MRARDRSGKDGTLTTSLVLSIAALVFSHACDATQTPKATPDVDTPEANVVVKVGQCTGTLITPRVVLTASHCVNGAEKPAGPGAVPCSSDPAPDVSIGPAWLSPEAVLESIASVTKVTGCQPTDKSGEDLALVYLIEPVAPSDASGSWSVPRIVRPSLVPPPSKDESFEGDETAFFSGYSPWDDAYKTWVFSTRRIQPLANIRVEHATGNGGAHFYFDLPSGVHAGDSGGPMFFERPDGSRDPIGVLSQARGITCYLTDITWSPNKEWLVDHVTERGVNAMAIAGVLPPYVVHTPKWLESHGKTLDDWWGELDYSGPCDTVHDTDCDGWWDQPDETHPKHDNCVETPDPSQTDSDDDGVGDGCTAAGTPPPKITASRTQ